MMDLVAYTPRRPNSGETLRGDSFAIALGGKGFNQAIAAGAQVHKVRCSAILEPTALVMIL